MKKYILSPLCSALVIPGLGQIMNQSLKKGLCILSIVFILFIAGTVKLALIINSILAESKINGLDSRTIIENVKWEDFSILWVLMGAFAVVWVYSVLDAFWTGKKLESQAGDDVL